MPVQTLPFQSLITLDRALDKPVFQQLADGLVRLIREGLLKPGFQLLPSRTMAAVMHVNRTTVVAAYDELHVQGWVEVIPRQGITVSNRPPVLVPKPFHEHATVTGLTRRMPDFYREITQDLPAAGKHTAFELVVNDGYPDSRIAPIDLLTSRYKLLLTRHLKQHSFINELPAGATSLRTELAAFLSQTRGFSISPDNILLTRGAQAAIYIAAQMIVRPGSRVVVSELSYSMANKVFKHFGATLVKVPVDANGVDIDMVEAICKAERPDLLYIVPHHHHPTTVTLSAERRLKLMKIIQEYRLPVIEDDYDYDFHYDNSPILPLASADPTGLILYIGSITKTLALTIRSGYIVAGAAFIWQASKLKELIELRGDYLMEDAIAYLFNTGEMQRHITRSVKIYKTRRDLFCNLLAAKLPEHIRFTVPAGGMAVWGRFAAHLPLPRISDELAKQKIYLNDGSIYNQGDPSLNGVRLGFASLNEPEIETLTNALAEVVAVIQGR